MPPVTFELVPAPGANALLWKCVPLHLAASENVAVSGRTSTTGQLD